MSPIQEFDDIEEFDDAMPHQASSPQPFDLSRPRVSSVRAISARPKIASEIAAKSDFSPKWLGDVLGAVGSIPPESLPTGRNILNIPNNLINAVAGRPVVANFNGLDLSGVSKAALEPVEQAIGIPGALTSENSPATGVGRSADALASGLTDPDVALTLPAYATGIPEALAIPATAARAVMAGQAIAHIPEASREVSRVFSDPNATGAQKGQAAANQAAAVGIAGAMAHQIPGRGIESPIEEFEPQQSTQIERNPNAIYREGSSVLRSVQPEPIQSNQEVPGAQPGNEVNGGGGKEVPATKEKALTQKQELDARGYSGNMQDKMTPEQKAQAVKEVIPSLEEDAAKWHELNDAIKNEPDFKKKFELLGEFGQLSERIKNRNTKSPGNPPERPLNPESVATEAGVKFVKPVQMAGKDLWMFEDKNQGSFLVPKGATVEQIRQKQAANQKLAESEEAAYPTQKEAVPEPSLESSTPLDPATGNPIEPEMIGVGGARFGEVSSEGDSGVTGLAERVRKQREASGQTAPTQPGEGIAPEASVERGRQLLQVVDPEEVMSDFEATGRFSSDGVALARARTEQLAKETNKAEETFGTDSQEFRDAFDRESEWSARTKALQTEWARAGHAQQGEVEIDTGTYSGLARAYKESTGKDFTPEQAQAAKEKASKVSKANKEADDAQKNLNEELSKDNPQSDAEKRALDAANETVRQAAIDLAKKEAKERSAKAGRDKMFAEQERRAAQKKLDAANRRVRQAAVDAANAESKLRVAKADLPTYVWTKAREYIESGVENLNDVVQKLATDLGLSADKVLEAMGKNKKAKYLADEVWRKQQIARNFRQQTKQWLSDRSTPGYLRALQSVPKILFGLKVGFHGTVALGTHAPAVAFQPPFWKTYVRDFGKMYKMVGSRSYYEQQVQSLIRRPNYVTARRAGLVNDPFTYEDYNSPQTATYFGNLTGMGNRGYSVLKILRQDMFDQQWGNLPKTAQVPEVAQAISDGINHATGVVKGRAPSGANLLLFAPRLEGSRVAWIAADPVKALATAANWKNATQGEKIFAINQVKEKAWVAGTLYSLLALNQGFLSATDSDQKINLSDPMKSDFLKFKAAGMEASYGNAMLSMARLPIRLYQIRESNGGKLKNLVHPDENSYTVLGEYARSQLSPFASLASSLWFKSDWQNRPLPNSTRDVPKRLREQGVKPYTWPEFWSEQMLPIPIEEAAREVWKNGLGMNPEQIKETRKAMATIAFMAATGGRLVEDPNVKNK